MAKDKKQTISFKTREGKMIKFNGKKRKKSNKKKIVLKSKLEIKLINLNNKTRKGKYYRIKEAGKKIKYYKYKKDVNKKDYIYAYKKDLKLKRGGVKKEVIKKEKKIQKLGKKYPKIDKILGRGYTQYTIKNTKGLTPQGIKLSYERLLMNKDKVGDGLGVVRDPLLLDLITRGENVDKWKHRIQYEIILKTDGGDILTTIKNINVKLLSEIKSEVIDNIKIGLEYESQYKTLGTLSNKSYSLSSGMVNKGKVKNIDIKMTFRKGKV